MIRNVRGFFDGTFEFFEGENYEGKVKLTQPGQALDIRTAIQLYGRGQGIKSFVPKYDEELQALLDAAGIPEKDWSKLDYFERLNYAGQLNQFILDRMSPQPIEVQPQPQPQPQSQPSPAPKSKKSKDAGNSDSDSGDSGDAGS